jgi:cation transport protein ChaC
VTQKSSDPKTTEALARARGVALPTDGQLTRDMFTEDFVGFMRDVSRAQDGDFEFRSDEAREADRAEILGDHPSGEDLWFFGYGSLIWNPAVLIEETSAATLEGYHRAFCLSLVIGRGTPQKPGYMLALEEGGTCSGVIHRIRADKIDSETCILWRREMLGTGYRSIWAHVQTPHGPQRALTFIVNTDSPRYVGQPDDATLIAGIAEAQGPIGKNADYVFSLCDHLAAYGMPDAQLETLAARVREYMDKMA